LPKVVTQQYSSHCQSRHLSVASSNPLYIGNYSYLYIQWIRKCGNC